ncbi:MAG: FkbM family methyltransferase [Conexibacter sp.]|nr:FkbM family methyltransferase [Conexibacter sp.]
MGFEIPDRLQWLSKLLLTATPLRSLRVRRELLLVLHRLQRIQRRRLEARGDDSRSRPALFEMDVRLAALLGTDGYFVEAGANDGFTQSNTYLLERFHGWRGLLVEPTPALAAEATRERPRSQVVRCALVPPEQAGTTVTLHDAGLMSLVAGAHGSDEADREWVAQAFLRGERDHQTFTAPGRTLSDVVESVRAPQIDLLSLDLEGYEPQALRGLDLGRHAPRWLLVEAHDDAARDLIEAELGDRYVRVERFSPTDMLYRRADVVAP